MRFCIYGLVVAIACASVRAPREPEVEATLTRGGGLTGGSETIRAWVTRSEGTATWQRSDQRGSRAVRLSASTVAQIVLELDSLVGNVPPAVADRGPETRLCGDAVTTHLTVRRASQARTAHEGCPHAGTALAQYWARVDSLFDLLAHAAH